jgi:hypothetical protein
MNFVEYTNQNSKKNPIFITDPTQRIFKYYNQMETSEKRSYKMNEGLDELIKYDSALNHRNLGDRMIPVGIAHYDMVLHENFEEIDEVSIEYHVPELEKASLLELPEDNIKYFD